ncbi:MAG: phosphotransacetylase family protein [Nitrospirota bacterium]
MVTLYIGSTSGYSGKSLITMGMGLKLKDDSYRVGYIKPMGRLPVKSKDGIVDSDAEFMKKVLDLKEPAKVICPVVLTFEFYRDALHEKIEDMEEKVIGAYNTIKDGKDIVLVGGAGGLYEGYSMKISGLHLIKKLDAKVIIVDRYTDEVCIDCLLAAKESIGKRLAGVILNKVPMSSLQYVRDEIALFLKKRDIEVFGVIPQDKLLNSITVQQLSDVLNGKVVTGEEYMEEFVENFSIGAMDVDSALRYFRRIPNKAVITGGHRADIQLAALETSTRCLILTGDMLPNDVIIGKAQTAKVPIISVRDDTFTTVEKIEGILGKIRIREERKVTRAREILLASVDFQGLYRKIGL